MEYEFYHCQNLDKFGLMNMYTLGVRIHTRVRIRTNSSESVAPRLSQLPVQCGISVIKSFLSPPLLIILYWQESQFCHAIITDSLTVTICFIHMYTFYVACRCLWTLLVTLITPPPLPNPYFFFSFPSFPCSLFFYLFSTFMI